MCLIVIRGTLFQSGVSVEGSLVAEEVTNLCALLLADILATTTLEASVAAIVVALSPCPTLPALILKFLPHVFVLNLQ